MIPEKGGRMFYQQEREITTNYYWLDHPLPQTKPGNGRDNSPEWHANDILVSTLQQEHAHSTDMMKHFEE
jgi:hypothetical protein